MYRGRWRDGRGKEDEDKSKGGKGEWTGEKSLEIGGMERWIASLLKVHKIENFFGFDFEFCVISLLVMLKY